MKNTGTFAVVGFIVVVAIAISGYIWLRNPAPASQSDPKPRPNASNASNTQTNQTDLTATLSHLYGKASLSVEEQRILYEAFPKVSGQLVEPKTLPRAYRIGMICLKHRLRLPEVQEVKHLTTGDTSAPYMPWAGTYIIALRIGFGKCLDCFFDEKGNLEKILATGAWYQFPPPEQVTTNTSIDPPPLPASWKEAGAKIDGQ